jgi:hypothetical protein
MQITTNSGSSTAGGFDDWSVYRWMQGHLYYGFPYVWRSMMKRCKIDYVVRTGDNTGEIETGDAVIWLPSCVELTNYKTEPWVYAGKHVTYLTSNPTRVRFAGVAPRDGYTTHSSPTDPAENDTVDVQEGDVWINTTSGNNRGFIRRNGAWMGATQYSCRDASLTNSAFIAYIANTGQGVFSGVHGSNTYYVLPRFSI